MGFLKIVRRAMRRGRDDYFRILSSSSARRLIMSLARSRVRERELINQPFARTRLRHTARSSGGVCYVPYICIDNNRVHY